MKLQPVITFDDLISEANPERVRNKFYNPSDSPTMTKDQETPDQSRADDFINRGRSQNKFDPSAENEKQLKQELIDTLDKADHNYVDSAERVRNYINDEIEFGEDAHERIDHAKESVSYTHLTLPTICSV